MKNARAFFILVALCAALAAVGFLHQSTPIAPASASSANPTVEIGGDVIHVLIADTPALQERGLGGRDTLAPGEGMLFIFPVDGKYAFWMKDMQFSIDILWLGEDGRIVDMAQRVAPDTYPASFVPKESARYVLELPAGYAMAHNVKVGDVVHL